jgi:hypothetical protein
MVAQQRLAAFRLGVVLFILVVFAALLPAMGPQRAQAAFSLMVLIAAEPFLFSKRRAGPWDERDRALHLRSLQISIGIVGLLLTAALWTTYGLYQHAGTISVQLLPWAAWLGWIAFLFIQSVTILVLYRLG